MIAQDRGSRCREFWPAAVIPRPTHAAPRRPVWRAARIVDMTAPAAVQPVPSSPESARPRRTHVRPEARMRHTTIGVLVLAMAAACHTAPQPPVRVQGDPASMARLAGSWSGQYWGGAGGRGGSLAF